MTQNPRNKNRDFKGIWIPRQIWLMEELSPMEKILFAEIDSLDNEEGCYASNEYFAEFLGKSERSVRRYLEKLKNLELIEIVDFDGRRRVIHSLLSYGRAEGTNLSGDRGQNCPGKADKSVRPYIKDKKDYKKGDKAPPPSDRTDRTKKDKLHDVEELEKRGWNK